MSSRKDFRRSVIRGPFTFYLWQVRVTKFQSFGSGCGLPNTVQEPTVNYNHLRARRWHLKVLIILVTSYYYCKAILPFSVVLKLGLRIHHGPPAITFCYMMSRNLY